MERHFPRLLISIVSASETPKNKIKIHSGHAACGNMINDSRVIIGGRIQAGVAPPILGEEVYIFKISVFTGFSELPFDGFSIT